MAPMPLVDFLADDDCTGTNEPIVHGDGKHVALGRGAVQWVLGGMFYQVMRGMTEPGPDRNDRAVRQAKRPTDEVLRVLPDVFDLDAVEAAATPVLSGLYHQNGSPPAEADTLAAELVTYARADLRRYTRAD